MSARHRAREPRNCVQLARFFFFFFSRNRWSRLRQARCTAEMMGLDGKRKAQVFGLEMQPITVMWQETGGLTPCLSHRSFPLQRHVGAAEDAEQRTDQLGAQEHCTPSGNYMIGTIMHNSVWHISQSRYYYAQLAWWNYYKLCSSATGMIGSLKPRQRFNLNNEPCSSSSWWSWFGCWHLHNQACYLKNSLRFSQKAN